MSMSSREEYRPLIFISHSAKEERAGALLHKLYAALDERHEVLLDWKRLEPDDDWRAELHAWMGMSHGAVLLLSDHALKESEWVKKEATILGYRREVDEEFVLVPILLPPATPDALKQGTFEPLGLDRWQMITGGTDEEIVARAVEVLQPLKEKRDQTTPLWNVEKAVGDVLTELGRNDSTPLLQAAEKLGKRLVWRPDVEPGRQLARELLSASFEEALGTLVYLAERIRGASGAKLVHVLDRLNHFWVNPDALADLPRIHERPPRHRVVSVNGVLCPFTGKSYVRRASTEIDWIIAEIRPNALDGYDALETEQKAEAVLKDIRLQLVDPLGFEDGYRPTPQEIDDRCRDFKEPIFVLVPMDFDAEVLALIRERFPFLTYFMLSGERAPAAQQLRDWQIVFLKPELTPGSDQKIHKYVMDQRTLLRRIK